jgi:hypothetical protein
MKRAGNTTKPICIPVLSDRVSATLSDTVNTGWASTNLVDALQTHFVVSTDESGNAGSSAPSAGSTNT